MLTQNLTDLMFNEYVLAHLNTNEIYGLESMHVIDLKGLHP
jgi:hypothetical protein